MAVVTKTIKTSGGDYTTTQLWFDGTPADFVSNGNAQRGELYRGVNGVLSLTARTTDATNYLELTAAAGESFVDDASLKTNGPLDVNFTNYAGLKSTATYTACVWQASGSIDYFRLNRLILETTQANGSPCIQMISGSSDHWTVTQCILKTAQSPSEIYGTSTVIRNSVFINTGSSGDGVWLRASSSLHANTIMRVSNQTPAGQGISVRNYSTCGFTSNAVFGYSTPAATNGGASNFGTCSHNVTDAASGLPGSNNVHGVSFTSTTPFVQGSNTSTDTRSVAGTSLAAAGLLDGTNAPNDIFGTARSSTPYAGAFEASPPPNPWWAYAQI